MPNIREPQKVTSIDKKRRIIEAGLKAFSEQGYYKTNTAQIAKYAGVSTGIVYSYFNDKKDILVYAVNIYFENLFAPIDAKFLELKERIKTEDGINEMIETIIKSHEKNYTAHEEMVAMSHLDGDIHDLFMENEHTITKNIIKYLEAANINCNYLEEKAHMAYNIIENLVHEYVFHKHEYINYDVMIKETIRLIKDLFKQ